MPRFGRTLPDAEKKTEWIPSRLSGPDGSRSLSPFSRQKSATAADFAYENFSPSELLREEGESDRDSFAGLPPHLLSGTLGQRRRSL